MSTASSMSLCIEASLKKACTATRKPDEKSVHQKMLDSKYSKTKADIPAMPMVAVFCGMLTPVRIAQDGQCQNRFDGAIDYLVRIHRIVSLYLPATCKAPVCDARITPTQAKANKLIPIIVVGLINMVKQNKTAATRM